MRRRLAEWLRRMADRIGPEDSFAASSSRFYFVYRIGLVTRTDDGIRINPEPRGVQLWYRLSEYDRAFTPDGNYWSTTEEEA